MGYIGIMENEMETIIMGYTGIMLQLLVSEWLQPWQLLVIVSPGHPHLSDWHFGGELIYCFLIPFAFPS